MDTPSCSIRVITSNDEFDRLEQEWDTLTRLSSVHIFQTFEWVRTWWKYLAQANFRLHIILFDSNGSLVGIAPLFEERKNLLGIMPVSHLQLIGRGLSDYLDFIVLPGNENRVFESFNSYLRSHAADWTIFDAEDVNEISSIVPSVPQFRRTFGRRLIQHAGNSCASVELPGTEEMLFERMGQTSRNNYKRKVKDFGRKYNGNTEVVEHESDDIQAAIENFSMIHGGRWKSFGHPSAFDREEHKKLHVEFSKKFARRGWLKIFILRAEGEPVAASFGFNYKKRIYLYQCNAYASKEVMRCSPGLIVRVKAMEDGIRNGMNVIDYMRGEEGYKFREWEVATSRNYLLRIISPSWKQVAGAYLLLVDEFIGKVRHRLLQESYEYNRFKITRPKGQQAHLRYLASRTGTLLQRGFKFLFRHV